MSKQVFTCGNVAIFTEPSALVDGFVVTVTCDGVKTPEHTIHLPPSEVDGPLARGTCWDSDPANVQRLAKSTAHAAVSFILSEIEQDANHGGVGGDCAHGAVFNEAGVDFNPEPDADGAGWHLTEITR